MIIRIGTRDSQLAVWQASQVKQLLENAGFAAELVYIKTEGDIDLETPLYALGAQGIFTRTLDVALLSGRIDLAVHSMKDVPTQLAQGLSQAAVLERADSRDVLVPKGDAGFLSDTGSKAVIATSSVRRKAQWLRRFPGHTIENIRGNINTRLRKVQDSDWQGAVFAVAGLERIGLLPANAVKLDWMIPAPAQGAIMVVCREADNEVRQACQTFHHHQTAVCVQMERDFLQRLMGGCTAPISALAVMSGNGVHFRGQVLTLDGSGILEAEEFVPLEKSSGAGFWLADQLIAKGADVMIRQIKGGLKA